MSGTSETPTRPQQRAAYALDGSASRRYVVENRTPWPVRVETTDRGTFRASPLSRVVSDGARLSLFADEITRLRQEQILGVSPYTGDDHRSPVPKVAVVVGLVVLLAGVIATFLARGTLRTAGFVPVLGAAGGCFAVAGAVAWAQWRRRRQALEAAEHDHPEDRVVGRSVEAMTDDTGRWILQVASLLIVVAAAVVLPMLAIYHGTNLQEILSFDGGVDTETTSETRRVVARVLQAIMVAVLSIFPALMFFQFDRQRVGTLRRQWVRNIFRLDGRVRNLHDLESAYGHQLGEASTHSSDRSRLLAGTRSPIVVATILIAVGWTILVLPTRNRDFQAALSAEIVLEDAEDRLADARDQLEEAQASADADDLDAASAGAADAASAAGEATSGASASRELSSSGATSTTDAPTTTVTAAPTADDDGGTAADGSDGASAETVATSLAAARAGVAQATQAVEDAKADLVREQGGDFFQLLTPRPSVAAMAFLGAYFFGVFLVLRGYMRGDLRPKVYNQITARLVTVVIVAYLINTIVLVDGASGFWEKSLLAAAFGAGVLPRTFMRGFWDWTLLHGRPSGVGDDATRSLFTQAFTDRRLLTTIDGIDIYDRERLNNEGITDIEALAHADIVRLMVNTRLDIERLLDWVDQAALQLHAIPPSATDGESSAMLDALHDLRIRTGTDLLALAEADEDDPVRRAVVRALGSGGGDEAAGADPDPGEVAFRLLVGQVRREPATAVLQHWARSDLADPDLLPSFYDGAGRLRHVDQVGDAALEVASDGDGVSDAGAPRNGKHGPASTVDLTSRQQGRSDH